MSAYKLRIKIGQHEFEAEGEEETVKAQFKEFKSIITDPVPPAGPFANLSGSRPPEVSPFNALSGSPPSPLTPTPHPTSRAIADQLEKIVRMDGKKPITMSALPLGEQREGDATLILLLAYKIFWQKDEMAGARLLDGLKRSGYNVDRVDRVMDQFIEGAEPMVLRTGVRRGVRYRLTTRGATRASELVKELAANVA